MKFNSILLTLLLAVTANAQIITYSGNLNGGSGGSAYETESQSYFTSNSVTNDTAKFYIDNVIKQLKRAGIYNYVVDMAFLYPSFQGSNPSSAYKTWNGATITNVDGTATDKGIYLNGTSAYLRIPLADRSSGMVFFGGYQFPNTANGTVFGVENASGVDTAGVEASYSSASADYLRLYARQGGTTSFTVDGSFGVSATNSCNVVAAYEGFVDLGFSFYKSVPAYLPYNQGNVSVIGYTTPTITSSLTSYLIGARNVTGSYGNWWQGLAQYWIVLDTTIESESYTGKLQEAIRFMRPLDTVVVFEGDSTTWQHPDDDRLGENYVAQFLRYSYPSNNCYVLNLAHTGDTIDAMTGQYTNTVRRYRPQVPGTKSVLVLSAGINNILNGDTASSTMSKLQTYVNMARQDGFEVRGSTLEDGVYTTTTMWGYKQEYNLRILTNAALFSTIIRRDQALISTNETSMYYDGLHASTNGHARFAALVNTTFSPPTTPLPGESLPVVTLTGTSPALDWNNIAYNVWTLNAAGTPVFSNTPSSTAVTKAMWLEVRGGASASITWPSLTWLPGVVPVQQASKTNYYLFKWNGAVITGQSVQDQTATPLAAIYGGTGLSSYTIGDTLYADTTTTLAKLSVNTLGMGQMLAVNASGLPIWYNRNRYISLVDDFMGGAAGETGWTAAGGAVSAFVHPTTALGEDSWLATNPGRMAITLTSTAGSSVGAYHKSPSINSGTMTFGGGTVLQEWILKLVNLGSATRDYTFRCGWIDSVSADSTDGAYFRYNYNVNSGNWECLNMAGGGGGITTNQTSSVVGTNYTRLGILVNAAATSVTYYVDGTAVATNTTAANIPTSLRMFQPGLFIIYNATNSSGTHAQCSLDYYRHVIELTNAR